MSSFLNVLFCTIYNLDLNEICKGDCMYIFALSQEFKLTITIHGINIQTDINSKLYFYVLTTINWGLLHFSVLWDLSFYTSKLWPVKVLYALTKTVSLAMSYVYLIFVLGFECAKWEESVIQSVLIPDLYVYVTKIRVGQSIIFVPQHAFLGMKVHARGVVCI